MKIEGRSIKGPNVEVIVIPRGDGQNIVFKAQAVLDSTRFNTLAPEPTPPLRRLAGQDVDTPWLDEPEYLKKRVAHAKLWFAWIVLESLSATPGLEWDTVQENDPTTWLNYEKELRDSGFSISECNFIVNKVMEANCLSDAKLKEARDSFLAEEVERQKKLSSPPAVPSGTQSGEAAKG